ncbi:MAG: hypothetical protein K2N23_00885 [Clostridia bacterium]|nr:hypothetical protein [Clostridia bacterium]
MFIATELNDIIELAESINVYNNGETSVYKQGETPYNQVVEGWVLLTENAHEMPAFGVSLNKQTISAMSTGLWVEFVFNKPYTHNEMPFEKLLVNVEKLSQGFNVIRYNAKGGYSGRCYYFDLVGNDMSHFYDILSDL